MVAVIQQYSQAVVSGLRVTAIISSYRLWQHLCVEEWHGDEHYPNSNPIPTVSCPSPRSHLQTPSPRSHPHPHSLIPIFTVSSPSSRSHPHLHGLIPIPTVSSPSPQSHPHPHGLIPIPTVSSPSPSSHPHPIPIYLPHPTHPYPTVSTAKVKLSGITTYYYYSSSSSPRMHVTNYSWSSVTQRLHLQSAAWSVLFCIFDGSGKVIRNLGPPKVSGFVRLVGPVITPSLSEIGCR